MESLQQFWIPGHKLCAVGLLKVHHNGALGECYHNGALGESGMEACNHRYREQKTKHRWWHRWFKATSIILSSKGSECARSVAPYWSLHGSHRAPYQFLFEPSGLPSNLGLDPLVSMHISCRQHKLHSCLTFNTASGHARSTAQAQLQVVTLASTSQ